jgi:hypothetical protein
MCDSQRRSAVTGPRADAGTSRTPAGRDFRLRDGYGGSAEASAKAVSPAQEDS